MQVTQQPLPGGLNVSQGQILQNVQNLNQGQTNSASFLPVLPLPTSLTLTSVTSNANHSSNHSNPNIHSNAHSSSFLDDNNSQLHKQILESRNQEINLKLEEMANSTKETENDLNEVNSAQERFIVRYQDTVNVEKQMEQINNLPNSDPSKIDLLNTEMPKLLKYKKEIDNILQNDANNLMKLRTELSQKHIDNFRELGQLHSIILDEELQAWKRAQALAYNGLEQDRSLDTIQKWCESLTDIIVDSRNQIKQVQNIRRMLPMNHNPDVLPELDNNITALLSTLVTSTFIIEKQPPQVLKTQTRFSASLRLLVGGKLNVHMSPPTVEANIISENQAKELLHAKAEGMRDKAGEILNNKCLMEYQMQSGVLSVSIEEDPFFDPYEMLSEFNLYKQPIPFIHFLGQLPQHVPKTHKKVRQKRRRISHRRKIHNTLQITIFNRKQRTCLPRPHPFLTSSSHSPRQPGS